ncbi:hypothetical protein DM01DRAFT_1335093 [Hesseltinella vesiculosa]|uniref:Uncharacterized protein n=1 Tax=Hesseltinella vesiculosa TaxID=101127 RepID=A0A1X2GK56_9FUNG|nr:hypothetical protein DM01DRAFT_1335093 [Hesseltinella vesiculosa]
MYVMFYLFILWLPLRLAQDTATDDTDDDDSCSYISGQNCDANGICKYCAMCLQSSCILSKSIAISNAVCNTTMFGTNVYDWYGYCLSSGNDNSGDFCATSTECYQYRKSSNITTNYTWQSLTCDPATCLLVTDKGQPAPSPGTVPPETNDPTNPDYAQQSNHHRHDPAAVSANDHRHPLIIALSVTCTLVVVVAAVWLTRFWRKRTSRRYRRQLDLSSTPPADSRSTHSYTPSSSPPSFRSNPEMTSVSHHRNNANHCIPSRSSSRSSSTTTACAARQRSSPDDLTCSEPLPSYFSPEPSPPKYEQAIVSQIRGLLEDSSYTLGASSSDADPLHSQTLPPPIWVPVYFTPHQNSFSLGRLRRFPPPSALAAWQSPTSQDQGDSEQDMADPLPHPPHDPSS